MADIPSDITELRKLYTRVHGTVIAGLEKNIAGLENILTLQNNPISDELHRLIRTQRLPIFRDIVRRHKVEFDTNIRDPTAMELFIAEVRNQKCWNNIPRHIIY